MKFIYFVYLIIILTSVSLLNAIDGKGTKDDPFLITNIYEFQQINEADSLLYYKVTNDIDASDTRNWNIGDHDKNPNTPDEPMGFKPLKFSGQIDGNGHIIYNLYINRISENEVGLFSQVRGNLTIKLSNILGQEIQKIVDKFLEQGSYNYDFDSIKFNEGIYICEIKFNGKISVLKLINVK